MKPEELGAYYESILDKEVHKEGGIYYTPQYIVDYIVEHTVGKLLQGKTPKEAARIKIVDPACGAGVFLLGVYQYLLDWHEKHFGKLTLAKRRKILTDNIFGIDIDPIAVGITKYCLSMMCSEGKDFSIGINGNICCGNSLIESDYYNDTNMILLSDAEMRNINAFDWAKEFPHVFHKQGGFDIIIGNPPWGQKAVKFDAMSRLYFSKCYPASSIGILDLFLFFIEKAFMLLRDGGLWGQVLPDIILMKNYESTRRLILDTVTLQHIAHWGRPFSQANIEVCTLIGIKETLVKNKKNNVQTVIHLKDNSVVENRVNQNVFRQLPGCKFNILLTKKSHAILQKFETLPVFSDYFAVHEGIHTGNARDLLFIDNKIDKHCKKLIFGREEVQRYLLQWGGKWVHYTKDNFGKKHYANLCKPEFFEARKIIIRRTGSFVLACLDEYGYYFSNNVFVCLPKHEHLDLRFFLGLMNSSLLTWYYQNVHPQIESAFPEIKINLINRFPMPQFDLTQKSDKVKYDKLVSLVSNMLQFKEREQASTFREREITRRRIVETESAINALVYELYGLADEEIAIVEGDT